MKSVDEMSDVLIESPEGKPVLVLPLSLQIGANDTFIDVRFLNRVIPDRKNPGGHVRTGGIIEELLQVPGHLKRKADDVVEADIVLGKFGAKRAGFHLKRAYDLKVRLWRLEISHPHIRDTCLFGDRFLLVSGKRPQDPTTIFKRMAETKADAALLLPQMVSTEIATFAEFESGSYHTPLLDIDVDGHLEWLLPIFSDPMEFTYSIHPGLDSVL